MDRVATLRLPLLHRCPADRRPLSADLAAVPAFAHHPGNLFHGRARPLPLDVYLLPGRRQPRALPLPPRRLSGRAYRAAGRSRSTALRAVTAGAADDHLPLERLAYLASKLR